MWIDWRLVKDLYGLSGNVRSTDAAVLLEGSMGSVGDANAASGGSSSSSSDRSTGWRGKENGRSGWGQRGQGGGRSCRRGCRKLKNAIAFARKSDRPDSESPRKRGAWVGLSSEHHPIAVLEATGLFQYGKDKDEKSSD